MSSKIQSIELPENLASNFNLWFLPEIHSNLKNHRPLLRTEALKLLTPFGLDSGEKKNLKNLDSPPTLYGRSLSLSHSPEGSVIFYSKKNVNIGVDIEIKKRISEPVLQRISFEDELKNKPANFDLFTSKEACWKALNKEYDLPTLSHIETHSWESLDVSWWHFSAKSSGQQFDGLGFSRSFQQFFLSFFILDSTFVRKHRQR